MRLIGGDNDLKVVVIKSALPDYFMAHSDLNTMAGSIKAGAWTPEANSLHQMFEAIKGSPKVFIAQIEGQASGSEFATGIDMSFAARGRALLSQPEVVPGLQPGGGSTQNVACKMGRQRALEVILS
jgi:enoyl-CoA hydratase/carnithine racemase